MPIAGTIVKKSIGLVNQLDRRHNTPFLQQRRTLIQLLKKAEHTAFGKAYHFDQVLKSQQLIKNFQQHVPFHDYDKIFSEWWHRSLNGEANVAWKGRVKYFALSSGTAGASSKYIPVTQDMTKAMRQGALRMFSCLPKYDVPDDLFFKDWLMIGGSASLKDLGPCYAGDLSGINSRRPPLWLRKFFKPGTQVAKLPNWDERIDVIARNAHKWDIGILAGIPSWVQLALEKVLEYNKLDNIHEIWPNLSVFVTGGVAFEPYQKSFESLLAHPLIYQDTYLASEGFIAFQNRPKTNAMRLVLNNGIFFEFIPFDDNHFDEEGQLKEGVQALTINEVKEGVDYALFISTCAGAWRYQIGDTVRFTNKRACEIIITGRTKHFLSICGEHLSVDNMNQAIRKVEEIADVNIREFTVSAMKAGSHFAHHWYLGTDQDPDPDKIKYLLDEALKEVNDDYRSERSAMLQNLELQIIPTQWFYDWQRETGRMNGQSKIPRVMKGDKLKNWETFIEQRKGRN